MPYDLLAAFAAYAFAISFTPGPNNLMLLTSGVNFGLLRTLPHLAGIAIGFAVMIAAIGLGLGQMFVRWPVLHTVLRWVSVVYMLWLAWTIANAGPVKKEGVAESRPMTFLGAALFQWVNPKAWIMAITAVSAYTVPASYLASLSTVCAVFAVMLIPGTGSWTLFGVALRSLLQDPKRVRIFNVAMALTLVATLVPVVLQRE